MIVPWVVAAAWLHAGAASTPARIAPIEDTATRSAQAGAAPSCDDDADRPPNPRCGETLDGRPRPDGPEPTVPRLLLTPPRLASRALFWPFVKTSGLVEEHGVPGWLRAWLTTDDGTIGVRPELEYASGFLPTVGAHIFNHRWPRGHRTVLRGKTAGASAWLAELAWAAPAKVGLGALLRAQSRRDFLFAEIGALSDEDLEDLGLAETRYQGELLLAEVGYARPLGGLFDLELLADIQRRDYGAGDVRQGDSIQTVYGLPPGSCEALGFEPGCIDPVAVPGFNEGRRIVHLGAGLALDRAPVTRFTSGSRLGARAIYGHGVAGDPSRHLRLEGEALWVLGGLDRTLRLRLLAAKVDPIGSADVVPFDELVSPTGGQGMRGFPSGRFRGRSALTATLEYRWFIAFNLDATLFTDLGTVAGPDFSGLDEATLFPSFGVGLRTHSSTRPYWQAYPRHGIQIAFAPERGFRLLLSLAAF